jgi:hypothetical protein
MDKAALTSRSVRIVEIDGKFIVAVHNAGLWRQLTWHHRRADAQRDQVLLVWAGFGTEAHAPTKIRCADTNPDVAEMRSCAWA